jgi:hypothetical protein
MSGIRTILYYGKDEELFKELKSFTEKYLKKDFEVSHLEYNQGELLKAAKDCEPNIVLLDQVKDDMSLAEELASLKDLELNQSIFIAYLCKDSEEASKASFFLTIGVQLIFIKGADLDPFFKDCFYMGLDEKLGFPRYAKASDLSLKIPVGILSSITSVSLDSMIVETDCEFDTLEPIVISLPFLESLPKAACQIKRSYNCCLQYPMLVSYEVGFPYPGPWDELTEESIQPETVETWLSLYKEHFDPRTKFVRVYSDNLELPHQCFMKKSDFFLDFKTKVTPTTKEELETKKPSIIFVEISEALPFDDLIYLVTASKDIADYYPIFIVLKSNSTSDALRKLCSNEYLIATPDDLDKDLLSRFMKIFIEKRPSNHELNRYFKKNDLNRITSIEDKIILTSITEHELTFQSSSDIPAFSVLSFKLPLSFYVTIIPPLHELHKKEGYTHYMGIIHGLSEEDLELLRKIVNQMIYNPVKELNKDIVEKMLKQDYIEIKADKNEVRPEPQRVEVKEYIETTPKDEGPKRYKVDRKKTYSGKSKL